MCSGSKFYSLSEEILTAITEDVIRVNSWRDKFPVLKVLRLVSLPFAYLKRIQKVFFAKIQITPTPTQLKSLELADMSLFSPYVKKINFVAPSRSWMLEYDDFKEAIVDRADGASHFSEEQIQAEFQIYRAEAEAVKTLLYSDALRVAWTRALRALRSSRSFRFFSSKWDQVQANHLPVQLDRNRDWNSNSRTYGRALALVGNALLAATIECLSEGGVEVAALKIACAMTTSSRWRDLPGWDSLNLTTLRSLQFQPEIEVGREKAQYDHHSRMDRSILDHLERSHAEGANEAVASVMEKSASHLEYFRYYGNGSPMIWPGEKTVSLPRLHHLELKCGMTNAPNLKQWMAGMPALQVIRLESLSVFHGYSSWLNVFDAIRDHPNGMRVCFDQIINCDWTELSLYHHTDDFEKYLEMEGADTWPEDGDRSLALYLSGKCGYNRALRDMLQDSDPEDEDGDEDEDEYEYEDEDEDEGEDAEDEDAENGDAEDRDAKDEDAEEYGDLANKDAEEQNTENV